MAAKPRSCRHCGKTEPDTKFWPSQRSGRCAPCMSLYVREYRRAYPSEAAKLLDNEKARNRYVARRLIAAHQQNVAELIEFSEQLIKQNAEMKQTIKRMKQLASIIAN